MRYKQCILKKIAAYKKLHPQFRHAQLARKIGIEPSYLSRFFTDPNVHFSDDLLFAALKELKLTDLEIDRIMTIKEIERCARPDRRVYLEQKLGAIRLQGIRQEIDGIRNDLEKMLGLLSTPLECPKRD